MKFSTTLDRLADAQYGLVDRVIEVIKEKESALDHDPRNGMLQAPSPTNKGSTLVRKRSCSAWCSCKCHAGNTYRAPYLLKHLLGGISVSYSSNSLPCNEKSCERGGIGTLYMNFYLPAYILRRYVAIRIRRSLFEGLVLSVSMPRVMDWSHLLWSYAQKGNVHAIEHLFSNHKASPFDVNQQGSNALIYTSMNLELTRMLLQQKADPYLVNHYGKSAADLLWERAFAGEFGSEGLTQVKILLQDFDGIEAQNFNQIHKIVLGLVDKDLRQELRHSTALLNVGDSRNRTPIFWAVVRDDFETVRTLLEFDADIDSRNDFGNTVLHFVQSSYLVRLSMSMLENGLMEGLPSTSFVRTESPILSLRSTCQLLISSSNAVQTLTAETSTMRRHSYKPYGPATQAKRNIYSILEQTLIS